MEYNFCVVLQELEKERVIIKILNVVGSYVVFWFRQYSKSNKIK